MIVAIIPAKGESSRLPNKNMYPVAGKPMIYYSIKIAQESEMIDEVYVSTDSDEIAAYAEAKGAKVIRRGNELGGETPVVDVYKHALKSINNPDIKVAVGIQPDHPDRTVCIDEAIKYLIAKNAEEVISVDRAGVVNGSLKIMKAEALHEGRIGRVLTVMDQCTNIHTPEDVIRAEQRIGIRIK